ncbi:hypothetical protein [Anaerovorax odorimutans]|uniref:hypothetical protein n=1 Tax=Anaerovorax odorimutans TaxID=109327 RepID=UPI00210F1BC1|nr:hypothetical protein [Anaerovorax odorimutans]
MIEKRTIAAVSVMAVCIVAIVAATVITMQKYRLDLPTLQNPKIKNLKIEIPNERLESEETDKVMLYRYTSDEETGVTIDEKAAGSASLTPEKAGQTIVEKIIAPMEKHGAIAYKAEVSSKEQGPLDQETGKPIVTRNVLFSDFEINGTPLEHAEIDMTIGENGDIWNVKNGLRPFEPYREVDIISAAEAMKRITKDYSHFKMERNADNLVIENVELGYWNSDAGDYMQPVWIFKGKADGKIEAKAYVPAAK